MRNKFLFSLLLLPFLPRAGAAVVDSSLIYHCHFDSAADVSDPAIGVPGEIEGDVTFVEGVKGRAAHIPTYGKGIVNVRLPNGMPVEKGKVQFYAKLEATQPTYQSAGNPTFLHVSNAEGLGEIHNIGITANNGAGRSGFLVNLGGQVFTMFPGCAWRQPYTDVFGQEDPNAWHKYSYVWNTNGLDGASSDMFRAYIDDRMVLHGTLTPKTLERYAARVSQPALMSLPRSPRDRMNNHVAFCVDELKIWSTDQPIESQIIEKERKTKKLVTKLKDGAALAEKKRRERELDEAKARLAAEAAKKLAPWACGTFVGGSDRGAVQFTLAETGALTGTYRTIDRKWALKAESFVRNDLTNAVCEIAVEFSSGEAKAVKPMLVTPMSARCEAFEAWLCEWETNPAWIKVAQAFEGKTSRVADEDMVLNLDVKAKAQVEVLLAAEGKVYETGATLVPSPESETEYRVFICVPKDEKTGFAGYAGEVVLDSAEETHE